MSRANGSPAPGRYADRTTRCGLLARYDRGSRLWRYYRLNCRTNEYEETGSTRRFQP